MITDGARMPRLPASFSHISAASRLHCGQGSLQQLPAELDRLGCSQAVIFCGRTLAGRSELQLVIEALGGRHAGTFAGVRAHSALPDVLAGSEALRAMQADAVIAVGGGSAVVSARAAGILLAEGADIHALCTRHPPGKPPVSPRLSKPKLPQFVVATTPTTACAKAGTAVLDPVTGKRLTLFDPKTRARACFFHPALALTAPDALVLDAALQALNSAVQAMESGNRNPLADALLLHALRMLSLQLPRIAGDRDGEVRLPLMLAAFLVGQGTDHAPTGMAAALAHSIGARFGTANGIIGTVLLPHTLRFNAPVTGERLWPVAEALRSEKHGATAAEAVISGVRALIDTLGASSRLRDSGISRDSLKQIAEDALADWFMHQNPRKISDVGAVLELLEAAW